VTTKPHVVVIDPALRVAETECFNRMALTAPVPLTYHLPAMYGQGSLAAEAAAPEAVLGLVILGSASSVNDRLPWQAPLEAWVKEMVERHRWPTFGICYGHQMLASMYGGKVDFIYQPKRKLSGLREVQLQATPVWPAAKGRIVISHQEMVTEVPPFMKVVASSPEIATDGLAHVSLPIWTLQAHPEATPEFLAHHGIPPVTPAELAFGHGVVASFFAHCARNAKPR
jgi:GMP synthase-like glutamine amidotransferase